MSVVRIALHATMALALCASWPSATLGQTATITGTVWDSIGGAPLADAAVFLWDTPHRGISDAEGRFRIEDVPAGPYDILFFHTRLGEMGVSVGPTAIVVEAGNPTEVPLSTPSMSTLLRTQCLMEERPDGSGIVAGRVLDGASDVPLGGAAVTLSWHDETLAPRRTIETRAGRDGWFRSCAVLADVAVLVSVEYIGRRNRRHEVSVESDGYTETSVLLYSLAGSRVSGRLLDGATGEAVEGAETWLRGTDYRVLTGDHGEFVFEDVPPGTYMLVTDHLAYGTKMDTLEVPTGQRLGVEMRLDNRPIEIAPLTVTVESAPMEMDRRRGGIVISAEQIQSVRQRSRDASDVLRSLHIPGVIVRHNSDGSICVGYSAGQVKLFRNDCSSMLIYVNDVRAIDPNLALRLPPDAIERMVIYKPVEAGNLFGLGGGNGVWVIYTR